MAYLQERRDKTGKLISYSIRVHRGRDRNGHQLKPYTTTFDVEPTWSEKSARKKAEAFAATFEKACREGTASDTRQTFEEYCDYCISLKEDRGIKHGTIVRYREISERIYAHIGHVKLKDLRPDMLNSLYSSLSKDGQNKKTGGKLSPKTILEHHRLIHVVLRQAVMEGLITTNPADRVVPPKADRKEVNYFQPEDIERIRDALEEEPLKWRTLVHLFLLTGARRGEIIGIKWEDCNFEKNTLHICRNVQYSPDIGIYVTTPKTKSSDRYISMPQETMQLLRQYKAWQGSEKLRLGIYYESQGFVFSQDNGSPMHPDSVTDWMKKFSKRHNLPHINPHAFRHTMASILYFNGADSVSIAKRLGHAQVSTTANIYAHVIAKADEKNAEILSDALLSKKA
ncbi:MAG: site-specific integrase [Ruminococcaceae bacterium]|nr:site-specific integrase [Oscillospiraceae bacterium]